MIGAVRRSFDRWRGGGAAAVTVPALDGALRPNRLLEEAAVLAAVEAPDNPVFDGTRVLFSSQMAIHELGVAEPVFMAEAPVASLAASGETLAVGLTRGGIRIRGGGHDGRAIERLGDRPALCPVALAFADADTLLVAEGSAAHPPERWKQDLMTDGCSGSVWRVNLASGAAERLADGLAWPYGLAVAADGAVLVAESWRHRLLALTPGRPPAVRLADLPGYPARLAPSSDGGWWLSVFAPRSQLIEFILREREFRERMMREIDPAYWMAPTLSPAATFLEPLQGGGLKHLGILKPWAPSRSYGLVVRLDADLQPVTSLHSRADGTRHGVTGAIEIDGRLIVTAKGGDAVLGVEVPRFQNPSPLEGEVGNAPALPGGG